tara:strand:- start:3633 stop:3902 length:270 start_codon:yes stop_codon:yes gene_type:complete
MDKTEKNEDSGNLIIRGEFYTLENIKAMIPMLDDVSYHKLYLRFNIEHLTEKEIEEEELLIKRLSINFANAWKKNLEKFEQNKVEEVEE